MYAKRNYGFWMTFNWSKKPFFLGFIFAAIIAALALLFDIHLALPWQPLSLIGIAVAFYLGFKNNSSYDRTWEARKIWGGIVNDSRSFAAAIIAFTQGPKSEKIKQEVLYRHIAWLASLQYQLRLSRPWEHLNIRLNKQFSPEVCKDYKTRLNKELEHHLQGSELEGLVDKTNVATQFRSHAGVARWRVFR